MNNQFNNRIIIILFIFFIKILIIPNIVYAYNFNTTDFEIVLKKDLKESEHIDIQKDLEKFFDKYRDLEEYDMSEYLLEYNSILRKFKSEIDIFYDDILAKKIDGYDLNTMMFENNNYCYINENAYIDMFYNNEFTKNIGKKYNVKFEEIRYFKNNVILCSSFDGYDYLYQDDMLVKLDISSSLNDYLIKLNENKFNEHTFYKTEYFYNNLHNFKKSFGLYNIYFCEEVANEEDEDIKNIYVLEGLNKKLVLKNVKKIDVSENDEAIYLLDINKHFYRYITSTGKLLLIKSNVKDFKMFRDKIYYIVEKEKTIDLRKNINIENIDVNNYKNSDRLKSKLTEFLEMIKKDYIHKFSLYDLYEYNFFKYDKNINRLHRQVLTDLAYIDFDYTDYQYNAACFSATKWDENVYMSFDDLYFYDEYSFIYDYFKKYNDKYLVYDSIISLLPNNYNEIEIDKIFANDNNVIISFMNKEGKKFINLKMKNMNFCDIIKENKVYNIYSFDYNNNILIYNETNNKKIYLYDINNDIISEYELEKIVNNILPYKNGILCLEKINSTTFNLLYYDIDNDKKELIERDFTEHKINYKKINKKEYKNIYTDSDNEIFENFAKTIGFKTIKQKLLVYNNYKENLEIFNIYDLLEIANNYDLSFSFDDFIKNETKQYNKNKFEIKKIEQIDFRFGEKTTANNDILIFIYNPVIKTDDNNYTNQINDLNILLRNKRSEFSKIIADDFRNAIDNDFWNKYKDSNVLIVLDEFDIFYNMIDETITINFIGYYQYEFDKKKNNIKYGMKYDLNTKNYEYKGIK